MSGIKNIRVTITASDECSLFNKVIDYLESTYNLRYLGHSGSMDLEDLSGVRVNIVSKGQYMFLDYADGGIVEVFLYTYYNSNGCLSCYIRNLVYR